MNLGPVDGVCRKKHRCLDCLTAQQPVLSGQCRVLLLSSLPVNLFGFHVGSSASVKVSLPSVDGRGSIFATELMWSLPLAAKERRACPDCTGFSGLHHESFLLETCWPCCVFSCAAGELTKNTHYTCIYLKKKKKTHNTSTTKHPSKQKTLSCFGNKVNSVFSHPSMSGGS